LKFGIDLLRHIFCISVLVQHMPSKTRYSQITGEQLMQLIDWVDGAVIGFFFLSGFLFRRPARWRDYAAHQSKRLLIPFFVFSLAYAVIMYLLDKRELSAGLWLTLTLKGSAPQLYFLTHLYFLTLAYAALERQFSQHTLKLQLALFSVGILLAILFPTPSAAGADLRLLPLYTVGFVMGAMTWQCKSNLKELISRVDSIQRVDFLEIDLIYLFAVLCILLSGVFLDPRLVTLFAVMVFIIGAMFFFRLLPDRRLPGSGGIYLLHTPVLNYAVSTALVHLSIFEWPNLIFSVLITYGICLGLTIALIRFTPKLRGLLLE
jgi:hypothetical protein